VPLRAVGNAACGFQKVRSSELEAPSEVVNDARDVMRGNNGE
jgi:hypothetical protein